MANKTLQFLRNAEIFATYEAALSGLQSQLALAVAGGKSGAPIIARYTGADNKEHILFGIAGDSQYEIFDNVASGSDVDSKIANAIADLDGEITSSDGTNVQVKVTEVDGVITAVNVVTDNTINRSDLVDVTLDDFSKTTDTGAITSSDTVNSALSKIENNILDNEEVTSAALNDLNDRLDTFLSNGITSADGTITIDTVTTPGTTDIDVNIDNTTIVKSNAGVLSADLKILKETSGLAANVKEQYKLVYGNSTTAIGDVVQIYKDSALLSVRLLHADLTSNPNVLPTYDKANDTWTDIASPTEDQLALCFAYENENGTLNIVAIPVGDFLRESEFGNGLQVVSGEVSVKKDTNSGTVTISDGNGGSQSADVLSVGANGVKVDNVQAAIDYAISTLDSSVSATGESNDQYSVLTGVKETDGKLTAKTEVLLSAVAKTGAASNVAITDTADYFTATNVENALAELALFDAGTY